MYLFVVDKTPKRWGIFTDACKEVADRMDFDNHRSVRRIVHNVIKANFSPTLLDLQEFYNKLDTSREDAERYIDKRKQRKA